MPHHFIYSHSIAPVAELVEAAGLTSIVRLLTDCLIYDLVGTWEQIGQIEEIFKTMLSQSASEVVRFLYTKLPTLKDYLRNTKPASPEIGVYLPGALDTVEEVLDDAITYKRLLTLRELLTGDTTSMTACSIRSLYYLSND